MNRNKKGILTVSWKGRHLMLRRWGKDTVSIKFAGEPGSHQVLRMSALDITKSKKKCKKCGKRKFNIPVFKEPKCLEIHV